MPPEKTPSAPAGKSNMMMWVIILVLILLAGGAAAYYKMSKDAMNAEETTEETNTNENGDVNVGASGTIETGTTPPPPPPGLPGTVGGDADAGAGY